MSIEKGPQIITGEQEIVDKLKQYQITLPNGQIVLARGKINNRILNSLVAAFKEGRPGVGSEELMTQNIPIGIPLEKEKHTFYASIFRLRAITLMGSGWDITTVVDNRGKRNAKGRYLLVNETPSKTTKKTSMETVTLPDEDTIISLNQRQKAMLQRIIEGGDKGLTTEELQQPHIVEGRDKKTARTRIHDDLALIRAALNGTRFTIVNLTSKVDSQRGKRGRYVFMKKSQEELAIIDQQKQNSTLVIAGGIETTVFVAKADTTRTPEPISEDPQEEYSSPWREWDSHGNTHLQPEISKKRFNELNTKTAEGILGVKTTIRVLSSLLEGSLTQSTKDTKTLLTRTLDMNPSDFGKMKLDTLFNDTSPSRLNRFFKVNFTAMLDDAWSKEITPDTPKEERQIIEIINKLKEKSYDKTRVIQEVLGHFGIKIPAEYVV